MSQDFLEVAQGLRTAGPVGPLKVVKETAHPLQAGGVEGLEDVEGGEEERAGTAGGVEDRHVPHGVPESAQQLRTLALGDDVPGEPLDIKIQRDEVVDLLHLAGGELGLDLFVSLTASDNLPPGLGGQRVVVRRRGVPAVALRYVVDARCDVLGQIEGLF